MPASKILIIDDDTDDVEILSDAFIKSGVNSVHYVHSAMEAFMYLEKLHEDELPKLIVTDMYLPGITGAEFLMDLKKMHRYSKIHIIVLSTIKSDLEIERYKQLGAVDYLQKPSSYEEYLQVATNISKRLSSSQ